MTSPIDHAASAPEYLDFDGARTPDDLTRPLYGATFGQAAKRFFKSYARFSGRASLSEYWWAQLMLTIAAVPVSFVWGLGIGITGASTGSTGGLETAETLGRILLILGGVALLLFSLAVLIPSYAIGWRRLHDTGLAGPWMLLNLVPYVGGIVIIVLTVRRSNITGRRFDLPGSAADRT